MLSRKLMPAFAAALALSIWGSGPAVAQSPDATANPRTPNERSVESAPSPSYGMDDRSSRGAAAPRSARSAPENRGFNRFFRRDNQPYAQQFPGDPNNKNNND